MIAWFAKNDVAANLLMISIVIVGAYALWNEIAVEIFPSTDPDVVSVTVPLRGATPEDVELGVAVRIEESLEGLEGIDQLSSRSQEGSTQVRVEAESGYDPRVLLEEVKSRVDAINTFPADAEKPVISLAQRSYGVIDVVIAGPYSEAEIRLVAEQIRDGLLRLDEISQVTLDAVRRYEIAIEASQNRLREFDLTLEDIAQAVRRSSVDLSAGNVRTEGGDVLLRSKGQAYRKADFESIVVKTNPDGSIIRVGDVAGVKDAFQEDAVMTRFDGEFAAVIKVDRVGTESALQISEVVKDYIAQRQGGMPAQMTLTTWDDDAQQLKNRLGIMGSSALQGGLLVIGLLALFLRPTIAFWVFIGIPISFIGAFSIMALTGTTLNLMSAFGFIVVLGIVVDDAIVTGESVYQRLRKGESGLIASVEGTRDVAVPVTFGVLTTMVAFAPLAFIEGRFGRILGPVAAVVVPVLLLSLVESKFVLPAHLKHMGVDEQTKPLNFFQVWQRRFADGFEAAVLRYYRPTLAVITEHRYTTLAAFAGVFFVVLTLVTSGWTRFTFMPSIQGETAVASLTMPVGTQFDVTDRQVQRMLEAAQSLQERYTDAAGVSQIKHVLSSTGSTFGGVGGHYGRVQFELIPPEQRTVELTTNEVIQEWRKLIGVVPGAESLTFRANFFRIGDPIDVRLFATSFETLAEVAEKIKAYLATYPTVFEIADSYSNGKEELRIDLKPQGHVLGLTRSTIVNQVSQAFKGLEAQRIQRGRDDLRVLVRFPADERGSFDTLNDMLITAPNGRQVPLSHVATFTPGVGPASIRRVDRYRAISVTAEVNKEKENMTVLQRDLQFFVRDLLVSYPSVSFEMAGEARQQRESLGSLQWGLVIVLFLIYCMLALPLKSYGQPLIVMSIIPFGAIGAVFGHYLMDYNLSMMSLLGLVALTGVVVNDSLVLVDYTNKQKALGRTIEEAVLNAGVVRFRPVMLTSLTTFFGLLPLLSEKSTTAQFLIPMGISLGFGILFATVITLLLVPANLLIANDLNRWLRGAESLPVETGEAKEVRGTKSAPT